MWMCAGGKHLFYSPLPVAVTLRVGCVLVEESVFSPENSLCCDQNTNSLQSANTTRVRTHTYTSADTQQMVRLRMQGGKEARLCIGKEARLCIKCRQLSSKEEKDEEEEEAWEPRTQMAAIQENHAAATSCLFGSSQNTSPAPTINKCALHPVGLCVVCIHSGACWCRSLGGARFHTSRSNSGSVYQDCHESGGPRTTATSHT